MMSIDAIEHIIDSEKKALLKQFLSNAPFDKWSEKNLLKSSEKSGFEAAYALILFPNGIEDLTKYFLDFIAEKTSSEFNKLKLDRISEKIIRIIEIRLNLYQQYKSAIASLLEYNLLPQNLIQSQKMLWHTSDQIWHLVGDQSTDFNYYTKRIILAKIYVKTILYWLSDDSDNFSETKFFLEREIHKTLKIKNWKQKIISCYSFIKNI